MAVDLDVFRELGQGRLPGLIGIEVEEIEAGHVRMRLPLRDELLAQREILPEVRPRAHPTRRGQLGVPFRLSGA